MTAREWWTVPQLAAWMRKRQSYFVAEIKAGRLKAVNLGTGSRPRYHISQEALDEFLQSRAVAPAVQPTRRPRRDSKIPQYV